MYQQSIDTDVEKGFAKVIGKLKVKGFFGKDRHLPHQTVVNPSKPGKVRRVRNAAAENKDVCLYDKLLAGPRLLRGLIGEMFPIQKGQ